MPFRHENWPNVAMIEPKERKKDLFYEENVIYISRVDIVTLEKFLYISLNVANYLPTKKYWVISPTLPLGNCGFCADWVTKVASIVLTRETGLTIGFGQA